MRYSATTSASTTTVIQFAREAFGTDGAGLRMSDVSMTGIRFESDVGFVALTMERRAGTTEVIIETREFDDDVIRFISALPRESLWRQFLRRRRSKT